VTPPARESGAGPLSRRTLVELGPDTTVEHSRIARRHAKKSCSRRGVLALHVEKQPEDRPPAADSPHAQVVVRGRASVAPAPATGRGSSWTKAGWSSRAAAIGIRSRSRRASAVALQSAASMHRARRAVRPRARCAEVTEPARRSPDRGWRRRGAPLRRPTERRLVVSIRGAIKLWDVDSGQLRRTLKGPAATSAASRLATTCPVLASAGDDKTIRLWT